MIKTDKGLVGKYMRCGMLSGRVVEMITPEWYLIRLEQWRELEGAKFPTEIVSLAELTECDEKGFRNYYFFDTREELSAFVQHIEGFKDADDGPEIAPFA